MSQKLPGTAAEWSHVAYGMRNLSLRNHQCNSQGFSNNNFRNQVIPGAACENLEHKVCSQNCHCLNCHNIVPVPHDHSRYHNALMLALTEKPLVPQRL